MQEILDYGLRTPSLLALLTMEVGSDSAVWQTACVHKRKKSLSPIARNKMAKKSESQNETKSDLASLSQNRFALLDVEDGEPASKTNTTYKEKPNQNLPKPPPIFIPNVCNIGEFKKRIAAAIKDDQYSYKAGRDGKIRLMASTSDAFRALVKYLDSIKAVYHTYQLKEDKAFRIVIKNLHHSTDKEQIIQDLAKCGYICRNVMNARSRANKQPLSMFFVDLEPAVNNKNVYDINRLCNAVVKIEPPHKFDDLVQCHRCQDFGHTKRYCRKPFKCVKCGDSHSSTECTKTISESPKCAHCNGSHTASYKGCEWYKKLLNQRNKAKPKEHKNEHVGKVFTTNFISRAQTTTGSSYADIVKANSDDNNCNGVINNNGNNSEQQYKRLEDLIIRQMESSAKQQEESRKLVEQLSAQVTQLLGVINALILKSCK